MRNRRCLLALMMGSLSGTAWVLTANAQTVMVREPVFDMGFEVASVANSRMRSVGGQPVVGLARAGNGMVTSGFLADSLSWSLVTGVDGPGAYDLPLTFELRQNYPNPFNPTTVVSWQLPVSSHVRLVIYDLLGREVATLVNEVRAPGAYHITWNAAGLASGVYLYRLTAGSFSETKKMLLLH
jgi:hypothetical protein